MFLGSFFRKHKRCCFDKLMYVRSIGFTLSESTRYTECFPLLLCIYFVFLSQRYLCSVMLIILYIVYIIRYTV